MQGPSGQLFYSHVDQGKVIVIVWDMFCIWVELLVQRRLCSIFVSDVGLPEIHEYYAG